MSKNNITSFIADMQQLARPVQIIPHAVASSEQSSSAKKLVEAVNKFCISSPDKSLAKTTHFVFVLDGSGSMSYGKDITVNGFNDQIKTILENRSATGETYITLIDFNSSVVSRYHQVDPSSVELLSMETYETQGGTALYDAIGVAIETSLSAKNILGVETGVLVSILTDGEENSSKYIDGASLGACIKQLEDTGKFTFAVMGPKAQLETMAQILNVKAGNISGFNPTSLGSKQKGMADFVGATMAYSTMRGMNATASNSLYVGADSSDSTKV